MTLIVDEDIQALMEVTEDLHSSSVDLILHSPGGSPEVAEAIVAYLRSRFRDIRVIVPNLAMSAATMIACSGNKIVMGKHSLFGAYGSANSDANTCRSEAGCCASCFGSGK